MARSENQKLKILYIYDMLMRKTDETHFLTTNEIISRLEENGVLAERKSIYNDIDTLTNSYNVEILKNCHRPQGYYVMDRTFELPEVKLLVDLVETSKFISETKSRKLIKKLETLTSEYQASELHREVVVADRVKSENESIYYDVDVIQQAIAHNQQISFFYLQWDEYKKLIPKRNGERYVVSPWKLTWSEENYYLVAFDNRTKKIKYYRVDKMKSPKAEKAMREGEAQFKELNVVKLAKKTFAMFAGKERKVSLEIDKSMIGIMVDRFGKDVCLLKKKNHRYEAKLTVDVSKQFYGWLTGFGTDVKIIGPVDVKEEYCKYIQCIRDSYR